MKTMIQFISKKLLNKKNIIVQKDKNQKNVIVQKDEKQKDIVQNNKNFDQLNKKNQFLIHEKNNLFVLIINNVIWYHKNNSIVLKKVIVNKMQINNQIYVMMKKRCDKFFYITNEKWKINAILKKLKPKINHNYFFFLIWENKQTRK